MQVPASTIKSQSTDPTPAPTLHADITKTIAYTQIYYTCIKIDHCKTHNNTPPSLKSRERFLLGRDRGMLSTHKYSWCRASSSTLLAIGFWARPQCSPQSPTSPRTLQVPPLATASVQIYVSFPTRHRLKSHLGAAILFSETIATVATCLETETSGSCSFSISFPWAPSLKGQLSVLIFLSPQEGITCLPTSLADQSLPNLGVAKTSYVPRNHSPSVPFVSPKGSSISTHISI